jgi:hypothetical protein
MPWVAGLRICCSALGAQRSEEEALEDALPEWEGAEQEAAPYAGEEGEPMRAYPGGRAYPERCVLRSHRSPGNVGPTLACMHSPLACSHTSCAGREAGPLLEQSGAACLTCSLTPHQKPQHPHLPGPRGLGLRAGRLSLAWRACMRRPEPQQKP